MASDLCLLHFPRFWFWNPQLGFPWHDHGHRHPYQANAESTGQTRGHLEQNCKNYFKTNLTRIFMPRLNKFKVLPSLLIKAIFKTSRALQHDMK